MKASFFSRNILAALLLCLALPARAQVQGPGYALNFTAANSQYVQVPAHVALTPAQLTFEAWVKPRTAKCNTILSRGHGGDGPTTDYIFQVGYDGTNCGVMKIGFFGAGAWESSTNLVPLNTWTHVAVTYDGTNKQFYINGVLDAVKNRPGSLYQSGSAMYIGRQGVTCNCNFFDGEMDEVRVWNVVRTPAQIQDIHRLVTGLEARLVANYRFDEAGGASTTDNSGNGHSGAFGSGANAPAWITATEVLGTPRLAPLPTTELAPSSATLNGLINPLAQTSSMWFEWGPTPAYGSSTAITNVGNGTSNVPVSATLTGLNVGTNYFRMRATNSSGTSLGPGDTFLLHPAAPAISNVSANVSGTAATLSASVTPNGAVTTVWFQYGPTTNYGTVSTTNIIGSAPGEVPVSIPISGLTKGTLYHFRCLATNTLGTSYSADQTFLTPSLTPINSGLTGVNSGSVAWGDYDNDGRLDVLLAGVSWFGWVAQVWRNTASGFTNINAGLPGIGGGSVAWGDYDNDGRLDILLTGSTPGGGAIAQVWRNTGSGFTNINAGLTDLAESSAAWGDYDNDGRLDILLAGRDTSFNAHTELWRNTGSGFTYVDAGLPAIYQASVAWGDYDNDGRLDVLLAGRDSGGLLTGVWRNTESGFVFTAGFTGVQIASAAWVDYDNDGRLDLMFSGLASWLAPITEIWRNTGGGFTNANAGLPGIIFGSVAWGDYDNDGRPDCLLTGNNGYPPGFFNTISRLWRNTGAGFFDINAGLTSLSYASAAWGDFDNDGCLDFLITGSINNNDPPLAQLWRNESPLTNSRPTAPAGLSAAITKDAATLTWNASSDAETPAAGLTYNLRLGTTHGGSDVVNPQANATNGLRLLPAKGNAQQNLFATVNGLSPGPYYWSVQAIDTAFAGSPFATESSFTIPFTPPVITELGYTNGQFQIRFDGYHSGDYTLQASSNLVHWTEITNFIAPVNSNYQLNDPSAGTFPGRYYRLGVH